ncbi:M20 metallopeptidase family protein [Candidatus Harpocratesius sp.]
MTEKKEKSLISIKNELLEACKGIQDYLVKIRRYFHQHPELQYQEKNTQDFILKELKKMGIEGKITAKTGVIAKITGELPGTCIALRADMDALAISEENLVEYRSKNPGIMHACGHDAHMASLLGAAKIINQYRSYLHGTLKLIFQPAEEGGGGAQKIVNEGHLQDVDQIYGIHVWLPLQSGTIGLNPGILMASADMFQIIITGRGGHAAFPQLSIDPTIVVSEIYDALQKLVTREINPLHTVLITTPEFHGSNAGNIIPSKAILSGTLRTFDENDRMYVLKRIKEICTLYAKAWRCECELKLLGVSYPSVKNSTHLVKKIEPILKDLGPVTEVEPTMGGEDFAFYQQETDGVFLFLGIQNKEKDIIYPHHHAKFNIDEDVLWKAAAIYSLLAFSDSI